MKVAGLALAVCALFGVLFFDLSVIMGILAGIAGIALAAVPLILTKRSGGKKAVILAGVIIGLTGLVPAVFSGDSSEVTLTQKKLEKIDKLLLKGQGMEVLTLLENLPEEIDKGNEAKSVRYGEAYLLIGDMENADFVVSQTVDEEKNAAYCLAKMKLELRQEQYREAMDTMKEAASIRRLHGCRVGWIPVGLKKINYTIGGNKNG